MATVTRTIGSTGKNYSTITAWEAATNLNGGADIWEGTLDANENYGADPVTFNVDGTSATSHVRLTTTSANRFAGVWDTGKARVEYTGGATAVFQIEADWVQIDWQQIYRPDSGSLGNSDEGIRLTSSCSNVLISYCLLWTDDGTTNDTDGIYIGTSGTYTLSVDNCVIAGWNRGCIHEQMTSTGAGNTLTLNLDHNTFLYGGESGGGTNEEAPLAIRQDDNSHTITAYNNIFKAQNAGAGTDDIYVDNGAAETTTLTGSHNCYDNINDQTAGTLTNNWTSTVAATAGVVETDTANAVIITETTRDATFDATLQDLANNVAIEAGTDRQGNEPDTRQDFSTAINGARGTTGPDLGAFQVSAGGPVSGTAALTYGGTVAATGTKATAGTATASYGGTVTATGTRVAEGTVTASYGYQVDATGTIPTGTVTGTATLAYGGTVAATGTRVATGTATLAYGGTVTATGTKVAEGTAALTYGGTVTATGTRTSEGTATASYGYQVDATGTIPTGAVLGTATLVYGGTLTATGQPVIIGTATLTYGGIVTATGTLEAQGTAALAYGYQVDATGVIPTGAVLGTATLTYGGTLTATGLPVIVGTVTLAYGYQVDTTATRITLGTATPTYGGTLTATGQPVIIGTAALTYGYTVVAIQDLVGANPLTLTIRDAGHTATIRDNTHTATVRERSR